ncbi:MAG: hypothetical protein AB1649_21315 [Chloroflexota bacterium]
MQHQDIIKFRDIPFFVWLFGLGFLSAGIYYSFQGITWHIPVLVVIGLAFLLLPRGLTITADKNTRTLYFEYWSLYLLRTTKEIPFDDIETIRVASILTSGRNRTRTYRVELRRKDGKVVPFRTMFSSGSFNKQKIAESLRAFIGLDETVDESPIGLFRGAVNGAAFQAAKEQEALTGSNEQDRITNGVHWTLQSRALGASPVTRWFSPDFKMQDGFLFIAQKVSGQSSSGLLASLGNALFQQSLMAYGFSGDDTPNLSQAAPLAPAPPLIDYHFTAFTNNQAKSRQILSPWTQNPLAEWAQRYPLKQFHQGRFSQIVVLFSPNGVYVATLGVLQPDQVDELTVLGVEMVRTQGVMTP